MITGGLSASAIGAFRTLGKSTNSLSGQVRELNQESGKIGRYRRLKKELSDLKTQTKRGGQEAEKARKAWRKKAEQLRTLSGELREAGINVKRLTDHESSLARQIEATNRAARHRGLADQAKNQRRSAMASAPGAVAGVAGLVIGAKKLITAYGDVKAAQNELASLSMGSDEVAKVTAEAKKFTKTWAGTTTPQFLKASYDIKSGISSLGATAVGEFTSIAAMTGIATKSTTAEMTSLFAKGYGIYRQQFDAFGRETIEGWHGLSEEERDIKFGEYFSAGISAAVRQFKTDGTQMSQSLSALGASATEAGVSYSEQLAVLGNLQRTMTGSEAATKYRQFLASAAKAGNKLKLNFTDANGKLKSTPLILDEIRKRYGATVDAAERLQLKEAFGSEEAVAMIELLSKDTQALQTDIEAMDSSLKGGMATTQEMAEVMNSGPNAAGQLMAQSLGELASALGKTVAPAFEGLASVLGSVSGWIETLVTEFPNATKIIGGSIAGMALAITGFKVGKIAKNFLVGGAKEMYHGGASIASRFRGRRRSKKGGKPGRGGQAPSFAGQAMSGEGFGGGQAAPVFVVNWPGGGLAGMTDMAGDGSSKKDKKSKAKNKSVAKAAKKGGFWSKISGGFGKFASKIGFKGLGKGFLKSATKFIPGLGALASLGFAIPKLLGGDLLGAGGELASGALSLIPGLGPLAALALDAGMSFFGSSDDKPKTEETNPQVAEATQNLDQSSTVNQTTNQTTTDNSVSSQASTTTGPTSITVNAPITINGATVAHLIEQLESGFNPLTEAVRKAINAGTASNRRASYAIG